VCCRVKTSAPPKVPNGAAPREREELERLRARVVELEAAARTEGVSALVGMIAHELRSPLQTLTVNVQLTAERVAAEEAAPRAWLLSRLEVQRRAIARLARLVETFLDVAQMAAGHPPAIAPTALDLRAVVAEVIAAAAADLAWAGCACELRAPTEVRGRWDRGRIEIIAGNLLSNAMKYGAGRPIVVDVEASGPAARLRVTDHGHGIAPADQPRIFEKFTRLPSAPTIPGVGLGLWIVESLVAAMGGTIEVASALGQGATFTVTLPRD
jgi:signal transduction histidine kinase